MLGVVVQIDGFDPVLGQAVMLRAASHDDAGICHLGGGEPWWPALTKLPTLRYDLFDGAFGGEITAPSSSLALSTEPWPNLGRYALADARLQLWTGEVGEPWGTWVLRFDGRVSEQPEIMDGKATVAFAVDDRWLDAALLATYAGTSGAEGMEALKGQPKPLALGAPRYVPGTLIDSVNSVFQLSAYGPVHGFEAALEKLARYGNTVGDFPSYAALVAANVPAGRWATAKAVGMARLGAPPTGQISFLLAGDEGGPNGWAQLPGQIIRRLALLSGGAGRINDASLNALDAARPYTLSVNVDQQTTARQLIQQIAASVNAVAGMSWTGQLFVVPVGITAPTVMLAADGSALPPVTSVKQIAIAAPFQKLAIGAMRAWTVHALSDIAFTAPLVDVGLYNALTIYREGNIVSLPDGSRWLYVSTAAAAGNPPIATDPAHWSSLNPALKAANISYADGQSLEALKPAEPGSTSGATIGKDVKTPTGEILAPVDVLNSALVLRPDGTLVATIGDTTRPLGRLNLIDMGAANDAARRQLESDLASLSAAVTQLAAGQQIVNNVFRDAGLFVDEASGIAKLFAIESRAEQISRLSVSLNAALASIDLKATVNYVDQAILQAKLDGSDVDLSSIYVRLTSAETSISGLQASIQLKADATIVSGLQGSVTSINQSLDALNGLIASKASQTIVDGLGARLTLAEQVINAFDGASISNSVTASRRAPADADVAGASDILSLLGGFNAQNSALLAIAAAKTELRAFTDSNTSAIASLATQLGAQIGAVTAMVSSEQAARIEGDRSTVSDLATYKAATNGTLATVNAAIVAQADTLTAMGGRLDTYDASLGRLSGRITDEHTAWVAGDEVNAQALQSYRSQTDTALSQANTKIGTVAGDLSALSSTVTTVSTTVGSHTATLTTYGQSINGLRLRWGVEFNNNGAVTGFALNDGSGRTDATFVVNTFKIAQPDGSGGRTVFSIGEDGTVEMPDVRVKRLAAGIVDTDQIVGNALSTTVPDVQTVNDISADGAQSSVATFIRSTGGTLRIDICVQVTRTATGSQPLRMQLFRNDGTALSGLYKCPSAADAAPVTFFATDRPAAGDRGYYVAYSVDSGGGGSRYNATHVILITELKR